MPEDRQGTTLVLVARHEILMFPFERIRDVDRPARQERAALRLLVRDGGLRTECPRQPACPQAPRLIIEEGRPACSAC